MDPQSRAAAQRHLAAHLGGQRRPRGLRGPSSAPSSSTRSTRSFHLGAQTIVGAALRSPAATFAANLQGTWNVLEAARLHSTLVRSVVVASSDKAYGTAEQLPYTEDMPLAGRGPYDVSKSCTDLLATSYAQTYGLPALIARCGNIYGGGDLNWSRIVPGTIRSVLQRRAAGAAQRRDVPAGLHLRRGRRRRLPAPRRRWRTTVATSARPSTSATSRPSPCARSTTSSARQRSARRSSPRSSAEAEHEIRDQYLSAAKAKTELGWSPRISVAEGLEETVAWYRGLLGVA